MRLWRLSGLRHAEAMDGCYGLYFDGRWNTAGRPVTYSATSPSLCLLEKLVHVEDPHLLPTLAMVSYEVGDDIQAMRREIADLPGDWREREGLTQQLGNEWLDKFDTALLFVPSVIVPIADGPDWNVLMNPRHPDASTIKIARIEPFELDVRLFKNERPAGPRSC
jgi:RES domain-containing protein